MEDVNKILAELAAEHIQSVIDADYDSYVDNMMAQYNMRMYEAHSYDLDAISYGE
mgnify:CR=1 FL=1